ncbi:MAG: hypothetical protein H8D39_03075 [Candidatus Atribacteria bacterium]|nr:hypothetical protein [Candidatus Atribacteria bacterium]
MEWTTEVGCAQTATIAVGTESGETFAPTIQLKDWAGNNLTVPAAIVCYVSNVATGLDVDTISGEVALTGSGNGAVSTLLTHYAWLLISEANGTISVTITDTGTGALYLVLVMPNGKLVVSDVMTYT